MATLRHRSTTIIQLGGEQLKVVTEQTKTISAEAKDEAQVTLAASAADGNVTLFDSTAGQVDEPEFLALWIDPDKTLSALAAIEVEVTIDAVVVVFEADQTAPIIFTDPDGGDALDAVDGKLTKVRVRNNSASAVPVRLLALK